MNLERLEIIAERLAKRGDRAVMRLSPEKDSQFNQVYTYYAKLLRGIVPEYVYGFREQDGEIEEYLLIEFKRFSCYLNLISRYSDFAKAELRGAYFKGKRSCEKYIDKAVREFEGERWER